TFSGSTFHEFVIELSRPVDEVLKALEKEKIFAGVPLNRFYPQFKNHLLLCFTEMNSREEIDRLICELGKVL
ncbi:MAG: glycine dehydrogenase, partial [Deltaproteobacteria bacterium]|nr:glycine dehydrogenase [Deltaproteobacteria bacterium]